jgi:hypothetical protein
MQLVEEVKLVCCAADGSGKEKNIALQPRDLGGRVLESNTWAWFRHLVCFQFSLKSVEIAIGWSWQESRSSLNQAGSHGENGKQSTPDADGRSSRLLKCFFRQHAGIHGFRLIVG